MNISVIRTIAGVLLAFTVIGCDEDQPDPHSMDLAKHVANSSPIAKRAKIQVTGATKKRYSFNIVYPTVPSNGQSDATDLTRAMIRKLLADGQQPHDQKINIFVWGNIIEPGTVGESGHRSEPHELALFRADYYYGYDSITYEECSPFVQQWRFGHCS
jgi:hypothetical protein